PSCWFRCATWPRTWWVRSLPARVRFSPSVRWIRRPEAGGA
ncbi:uncharacterized protein METZ01_LOCUS288413, partial [marine metagenome]